MSGNSFGVALQVVTFGESHGPAVGCVVHGCPAGVPLTLQHVQAWLDRRRPGQTRLQSQRREPDTAQILSGVYQGKTLGTPIAIVVANADAQSKDYAQLVDAYRPGHADAAWAVRFGHRDPRGGGRSGARETVGRVAAGAVAQAIVDAWSDAARRPRVRAVAWSQAIGGVHAAGPQPSAIGLTPQLAGEFDSATCTQADIDHSPVRCPDPVASAAMVGAIEAARLRRDSLGGIVRCAVFGLPPGLGEPTFDKLPALLGHALLSLPACRGVQFGTGFAAADLTGSAHNDAFTGGLDPLATLTNHHGGTLGGITTGMPLVFDAAFKPPATIPQPVQGLDSQGTVRTLTVLGRHDPCVVPRAVPIVEAAVLLCVADLLLRGPLWRGPDVA